MGIRSRLAALAAAIEGRRNLRRAMARMLQPRRGQPCPERGRELSQDAASLGVATPSGETCRGECRGVGAVLPRPGRAPRLGGARACVCGGTRAIARGEADRGPRARADANRRGVGAQLADLWRRWLRLWPSRWDPEQRKVLSEYVSLLQMVATGDRYDQAAGKKVFRRYYSLFPRVTKILPCWAVTSLSARGRLPFEPGFFDLVVIDEASQCDIASALPLLLRARRAVIIGDPLQLKHVSTVAPQQDRLLLAAHGLAEGERRLGVLGQLSLRPGPQLLPSRGHRQPARPSPLASRHHHVLEPAFLSGRPAGRDGSRRAEPSANARSRRSAGST